MEVFEATTLSEAKRMAKDLYGLELFTIFNMWHTKRQADQRRRVELVKRADPIKAMKNEIRAKLKDLPESELKAIQQLLKTPSKKLH